MQHKRADYPKIMPSLQTFLPINADLIHTNQKFRNVVEKTWKIPNHHANRSDTILYCSIRQKNNERQLLVLHMLDMLEHAVSLRLYNG